jgi:hypothetical protein
MSRFDRVPDVPVSIGPCECPGTPHGDGDFVYLAPVLSAPGGMAAQGAISDANTDSVRLQELMWRVYRDHCIVGWNLVDDEGEPVPLTAENKEQALPYGKGGQTVADKADDLYNEDVLRPFLARIAMLQKIADERKRRELNKRSRDGTTSGSRKGTSRTSTSRKKPPSPSSTPATAEATPSG